MTKIHNLIAREILDSRGNPTVEAELTLKDGSQGRASTPSGVSAGKHEALELRDGDERYGGKGVQQAVGNINKEIRDLIVGKEFDQASIDQALISLDGTENKSRLGANAILAVSVAFAKAAAAEQKSWLYEYFQAISQKIKSFVMPVPMVNIMEGGAHAGWSNDFQEFLVVPAGAPSFPEAVRYSAEVFHHLKKILAIKDYATTVGDEGGFAPKVSSNNEPVELILEAIGQAGYEPGKDIFIALDVAASEFYKDGKYVLNCEGETLDSHGLIDLYTTWVTKYPIISIEDGLAEDDWEGWAELTRLLGDKVQIVGDDLFVTNPKRFERGINEQVANAILVKLNQIGTVTETIRTIEMAFNHKMNAIVSHRGGETEDTTLADLAVGLGSGQIKTGSMSRGERTAKYNQLLRIAERLGDKATYPGIKSFAHHA